MLARQNSSRDWVAGIPGWDDRPGGFLHAHSQAHLWPARSAGSKNSAARQTNGASEPRRLRGPSRDFDILGAIVLGRADPNTAAFRSHRP